MEPARTSPRWPLLAAGLLLAANVVVPLAIGDLYPFTSAPMFRDCPQQCVSYRVYGADGRELPAEDWLVQRIYDGNPVGYGVGLRPPAVAEQAFGAIDGEAEVRAHIARQLALPQHREDAWVEVVQDVIGPVDRQRVGVVRSSRWRVERVSPP
jgi:hypothetical protein